MPRFSRTRLRRSVSMSRKAFAYHQQRREGARVWREEGREEESEDAARSATAPPSPPVATPLPPPPVDFSTLSTPSTEDSQEESSAALRKRVLESKLPVSNPVNHRKDLVNSSAVEDIAQLVECNMCSGQCVVSRKQEVVDLDFSVECGKCGNVMYQYMRETVKIEGHRKPVGQNALLLVYHCMQHDLGCTGMQSLSSSLGIPLMSHGSFILHEKRIEDIAKIKFEEYSTYAVEAVFDYYESEHLAR